MKTHLLHGLRAVASFAVAVGSAAAADPHVRDLVSHEITRHPAVAVYVPAATLVVSVLEKVWRTRRQQAPPLP